VQILLGTSNDTRSMQLTNVNYLETYKRTNKIINEFTEVIK